MDLWTIQRLADLTAQALKRLGTEFETPDVRTLRYYTTIGLLDRPAEMRGRTAYYGRRHLLQLAAIKRLQAKGQTLAAIQERLAGASDQSLEQIAGLPANWRRELEQVGEGAPEPGHRPAPKRRARFWTSVPDSTFDVQPAMVVSIAPGVTLMLDGHAAARIDANALADAAPAIEALRERLRELGVITYEDGEN